MHFYKEYTLKIWNFTEFRRDMNFINLGKIENEEVFVNLGNKSDVIHNKAGRVLFLWNMFL